jgi:hypothetical protein
VSVVWSVLSSWLFLRCLICRFVQGLFLSLVLNFQFSNSYFPVTTLGLDLFSCAYLNKVLFCGVQWLEIANFNGYRRLGASLPKNRKKN